MNNVSFNNSIPDVVPVFKISYVHPLVGSIIRIYKSWKDVSTFVYRLLKKYPDIDFFISTDFLEVNDDISSYFYS